MTGVMVWYLLDAMYEGIDYSNGGLMKATNPWSGNYYVSPNTWVSAHTTQVQH